MTEHDKSIQHLADQIKALEAKHQQMQPAINEIKKAREAISQPVKDLVNKIPPHQRDALDRLIRKTMDDECRAATPVRRRANPRGTIKL